MAVSKLETEMLKDDECPTKFLHNYQCKWKDEIGSILNFINTTQSFKLMVKKAIPKEEGLEKMEWPV